MRFPYQKTLALVLGLSIVCLSGCAAADKTSAVFTQAAQTAQVSQTAETVTTADAVKLTFSDTAVSGSGAGVEIDGTHVSISKAGTYVLSGSCADGSVTVKKGTTGVTLVLEDLSLTASDRGAIACNKGTQVTIQVNGTCALADGEQNNDENYPDNQNAENAVIKCKDGSRVVLCGAGTLNIQANGKNGIKSGATTADGEASLTIRELTLNIDAPVNDAVNAEAALEVESGVLTLSAGDDALHCDYTLNIGAEGTDGPNVTITTCNEGLEGAAVNVFSGNVSIQSTDDCINAANADLTDFAYALNIYSGTIAARSDSGDGFDSNGDLTISGGHVTVWTANAADNEPLDADGTVTVSGGTVLAAGGSSGMGMNLSASQPCVIFGGDTAGRLGGHTPSEQPNGNGQPDGSQQPNGETRPARGGFSGGASLLTQGSAFTVADSNGAALYTGEAVYNASFVFFSSGDLSEGESYTLSSGETQTESAARTGTVSIGVGGQKLDGAPPSGGGGGQRPEGDTPRSKSEGENIPNNGSDAKA